MILTVVGQTRTWHWAKPDSYGACQNGQPSPRERRWTERYLADSYLFGETRGLQPVIQGVGQRPTVHPTQELVGDVSGVMLRAHEGHVRASCQLSP